MTKKTYTSTALTNLTFYPICFKLLRSQGKNVLRKDGDTQKRVERRSFSWTYSGRLSNGSIFSAVQYDPIHAALPWAGIRFLLQVCHVQFGETTH